MAKIIMLCGPVGSGKSVCAQRYKKRGDTVVLSCDDLMLTLFDSCIGPVKHQDMLRRCKSFFLRQAEEFYALGLNVVLDFGFWSHAERTETKAYFAKKGMDVLLCYVKADYTTISKHLAARNTEIDAGRVRAYYIDKEKRERFDSWFEEPSEKEIDLLEQVLE